MNEDGKKENNGQRKSYYEMLREKTVTEVGVRPPSGVNGFYATERRFGYILCALFLGILILVYATGALNWATREKELTQENYKQYFRIDVSATESVNWESFEVSIIPHKDMYTISNFSITIEVEFERVGYGDTLVREVEFSCERFRENSILSKTVSLDKIGYFERGVRLLSISGGM